MSRKFDTALDDSLNLLRTGASTADCLARYPEYAEELQPLLSLASGVKAVPTPRPDPAAVLANRKHMLDAVQRAAAPPAWSRLAPFAWLWRFSRGLQVGAPFRAALILASVLALIILTMGALFISAADSLPGQALYSVKRFGENVRLSLTLNSASRQELQAEYLLERLQEVRQVLDGGQQATMEFRAELEEIGDGYWIIGGLKVALNNETPVEGHVTVGAMVIVQALTSGDGSLQALKLQVLTNPLPSTPVITATPTPEATPTPTSTPAPTPTVTEAPSKTPPPIQTIISTPSPLPTETSTPLPTITSMPTHTEEPEPTDDPDPTDAEEPEATDEPVSTDSEEEPEATDEPHPTDSKEEDEEPEATDEPHPTDTEEDEDPEATDEPEPADTEEDEEPEATGEPDPTDTKEPESTDDRDPIGENEPDPSDDPNPICKSLVLQASVEQLRLGFLP